MMSFWKQGLFAFLAVVLAVVILAVYLPAARPALDRIGVLDPLRMIGLVQEVEDTAGSGASGQGGFGGGSGAVTVIAAPPGESVMNNVVTAIGNGQALRSVVVTPEATGRLVEVLVTSGDYVDAGAVIARLDDQSERIAVDRAQLVLDDAQATQTRLARLQSSGAATELQISDAALAVSTAELALREAAFHLERRSIVAPLTGWVGLSAAEVGDQVNAQTVITRIDDRSRILVEFRVPERFVGQFAEGYALTATPLARPDTLLDGVVSAIDNRVDEISRSLRVRAEFANPDDQLRAGMAFSITLQFQGDAQPSVDPLAIQWGRDGAFVWVAREGRAMRLPVRIMQRNADAVLVNAAFEPGDRVVQEGVQMLRPGGEVTVRGDAPDTERGAPGATDDTAAAADRQRG